MFSLNKARDSKGFTIIELLIVIVVIGILATLVVTTYSGIQSKSRDSKRQADIKAIQTQVEAFYAEKNYYPSRGDINASAWRGTDLKSLKTDSMKDPSGTVAEFINTVPTASSKQYQYTAKAADGTTDCTTVGAGPVTPAPDCASYTLSAKLENGSGDRLYTKTNLD